MAQRKDASDSLERAESRLSTECAAGAAAASVELPDASIARALPAYEMRLAHQQEQAVRGSIRRRSFHAVAAHQAQQQQCHILHPMH